MHLNVERKSPQIQKKKKVEVIEEEMIRGARSLKRAGKAALHVQR